MDSSEPLPLDSTPADALGRPRMPEGASTDEGTPSTAAETVTAEQPDSAQADAVVKRERTTQEQAAAFIAAIESGIGAREAATQCGVNLRTAYGLLARSEVDTETLRAVARKLMAATVVERLNDWRIASEVGARKKGNHSPAKEWLLHAGVLDQLDSDHAGIKIAINIGTDDRPMRIVSPLSTTTGSGDAETE